ncbi:MAG: hypothetical protein K8R54_05525 [Bacteroidales bacterium]|nr:hypothetical protein [Bacteroidales bacterium]
MNKIINIIFVFFIVACEPTDEVKFEVSQPDNVKPLNEFNTNIQGQYINYGNPEKILTINDRTMIKEQTYYFTILRSDIEIDSNVSIDINNDNELINYLKSKNGSATIKDDTIHFVEKYSDTIFTISRDNVLKKFKGSHYLNYRLSDDYWRVQKMSVNKDTLLLGEITPSDTLLKYDYTQKIEDISKTDSGVAENISKDYILNPTKKEFKKLVRSDVFDLTGRYIRKKAVTNN